MNFTQKHIGCFVLCLTLVFACSVAFANPVANIVNQSGHPLYIYDTGGDTKNPTQLADGKSVKITLPSLAGRKVFFAASRLSKSVETGSEPDPFNPDVDGNVMFSFLEYTSEGGKYTIDMSYVDVFSYPVTLKFDQKVAKVCDKDFEYGFKSFTNVANALISQGSPWGQLIWQDPAKKMHRIVAPNKVWVQANPLPPNVPNNYHTFYAHYPPDGTQLFSPGKNNYVWQNYVQIAFGSLPVEPRLMTVGYSKALLSAAPIDSNNKHGFYIFPKDAQAEFTNVPSSVLCTITVYPYDK